MQIPSQRVCFISLCWRLLNVDILTNSFEVMQKNKVTIQKKLFLVFIDLLTF